MASNAHNNIQIICMQNLEMDVQRLQKMLREEKQLQAVLRKALENASIDIYDVSCLSEKTQEHLSDIATLEETVSRLEEQMISLRFQLIQERNERKLVEYRLKQSPSMMQSDHFTDDTMDANVLLGKKSPEQFQLVAIRDIKKQVSIEGLWNHPNFLSEEMVRCMKNIFITLADSSTSTSKSRRNSLPSASPHGRPNNSSFSSMLQSLIISLKMRSPQFESLFDNEVLESRCAFDPYNVDEKLSWVDIGNYGLAVEVSWMSAREYQLEYATCALKEYSALVEQLAQVDLFHLSRDEKLAFWINLYNALIMHAYLAYGVPKSDVKLLSLMQKAAYIVGGQSFSAACIECAILKIKPQICRPQATILIALQKLQVSAEQKKCSLDIPDPLATFALSCGMYSSPAVKIYYSRNVREELQAAQRDFVRASVGISCKGKLLVPRMLHCFARNFVDSNFVSWISSFLTHQQLMIVEKCIPRRQRSLPGYGNYSILSFDSRFRYLFLPEAGDACMDPSPAQLV